METMYTDSWAMEALITLVAPCKFQVFLVVALSCLLLGVIRAEEFQLSNGSVLKGEAASFNGDGMVVKQEVGGFS